MNVAQWLGELEQQVEACSISRACFTNGLSQLTMRHRLTRYQGSWQRTNVAGRSVFVSAANRQMRDATADPQNHFIYRWIWSTEYRHLMSTEEKFT